MNYDKPSFISPGNFNELPLEPPFLFENMTSSVFPLRADIGSMQRLLDNYVNFVPPQVGRFRVAMPYVMLMALDYGKLALQATNLGWFSQTEILFAVPANHYTLCEGRWVYQGTVFFAPFIFVDSDTSMTLGRRVYGWAKLPHTISSGAKNWLADPRGEEPKVTLETGVFSELYAGRAQTSRVFCEIVKLPSHGPGLPFDVEGPWLPWSMAKHAVSGMLDAGRDLMQTVAGMGAMPAQPDVFLASALDMLGSANPLNPDARFTTVNLKQFRAAGRPEHYCYQALTSASMRVTKVNRVASLVDVRSYGLDPSGGFRVRLHRWPMLPIADSLGLEIERSWRGEGGVDVVEVKAFSPFWYGVDMLYERGQNLGERSHDASWRTPDGRRYRRRARDSRRPPSSIPLGPRLDNTDLLFNTSLGVSTQAIAGPFDALDAKLLVMPLLADSTSLREFLREYLNEPLASLGLHFEPWADDSEAELGDVERYLGRSAYVYLVLTNWGPIRSETDDIGDWKGEELSVFIPVRWYRRGPGGKRVLMGGGLIPATTYSSSTASMIANNEILGWPARKASFVRPEGDWIDDPSQLREGSLLKIDSEILPTMAQGQRVVSRTVFDFTNSELPPRDEIVREWSQVLGREVGCKRHDTKQIDDGEDDFRLSDGDHELELGRTLALDFLLYGAPLSIYSIKQFRDVHEPQKACYQALTRVRRSFKRVKSIDRLPASLAIRVAEYESNPLVTLLGLQASLIRTSDDCHRYWIKPVQPFWMHVSLREELGECVHYRDQDPQAGSGRATRGWKPGPQARQWRPYMQNEHVEGRMLSRSLVRRIDRGAPLEREQRGKLLAGGLTLSANLSMDDLGLFAYPDVPHIEKGKPGRRWEYLAWLDDADARRAARETQKSLENDGGQLFRSYTNIDADLLEPVIEEMKRAGRFDSPSARGVPVSSDIIEAAVRARLKWDMIEGYMPESMAKRSDRSWMEAKRMELAIENLYCSMVAKKIGTQVQHPSRALVEEFCDRVERACENDRDHERVRDEQQDPQQGDGEGDWSEAHVRAVGRAESMPATEILTTPAAGHHNVTLHLLGLQLDRALSSMLTTEQVGRLLEDSSPQAILESILSNEWGAALDATRRRRVRRELCDRWQLVRDGTTALEVSAREFFSNELGDISGGDHLKHLDLFEFVTTWWVNVRDFSRSPRCPGSGAELIRNMHAVYEHASDEPSRGPEEPKNLAELVFLVETSAGAAAVIGNMIEAARALKRGFEEVVEGLENNAKKDAPDDEGRVVERLLHEARKPPDGWMHVLVKHSRAAFEAELRRLINVIVAAKGDETFFVPPPFDGQLAPGASS